MAEKREHDFTRSPVRKRANPFLEKVFSV